MPRRRSILVRVACAVAVVALAFVSYRAVRTLFILERVEAERDTWQRPADVVDALALRPGDTVVDLGSGAGYFALWLAPAVGPAGRVTAVDIRRESLAFLWLRAVLRRNWHVHVVHSAAADVRLRGGGIDAVLVANTYHELNGRPALLRLLLEWLKPRGRLVIVDRGPHTTGPSHPDHVAHGLSPSMAAAELDAAGFELVSRDDAFIDRPGDDTWWMIVALKPQS